jgi:hypothetical protein
VLRTRRAPCLVGLISALAIWWVWGALSPMPLVQDEISYVLQSRIFATGHWTAPPPPLHGFFQQPHVLTFPAVASKFFPGHALLLTLGALLGWPPLIPLLLTGVSGALLFALARRIANEWVALFTWLVWLGDPINLRFRPGYFSEVTSETMWFISWWALLEWRASRRRAWLLVLAAAIGWGAITRPLTMLAFAVPVGVLVIRDTVREHSWSDLAYAMALGIVVLGIIPLWSARTTGDWRLTPQTFYTRNYLPYDKPGFGLDSTPPRRPLARPNYYVYATFRGEHVRHTPANLPAIVLERLSAIAHAEWSGPRLILVPFALLGVVSMSADAVFALACTLSLFVGYLSYGHWSQWTLYYFEGLPVLALVAGLGIRRITARFRPGASSAAAVVLGLLAAFEMQTWRRAHINDAGFDRQFHEQLANLPVRSAVVFVHYDDRLPAHADVVANSPHLARDSVWVVNDLGRRDTTLMRLAGSRMPFAFYEAGGRLGLDRTLLPTPHQ